jgi:hypothetical protein
MDFGKYKSGRSRTHKKPCKDGSVRKPPFGFCQSYIKNNPKRIEKLMRTLKRRVPAFMSPVSSNSSFDVDAWADGTPTPQRKRTPRSASSNSSFDVDAWADGTPTPQRNRTPRSASSNSSFDIDDWIDGPTPRR